jgi:hypothetical protein
MATKRTATNGFNPKALKIVLMVLLVLLTALTVVPDTYWEKIPLVGPSIVKWKKRWVTIVLSILLALALALIFGIWWLTLLPLLAGGYVLHRINKQKNNPDPNA